VVSSAFAGQAQYQAEMLKLKDVRVSFVRHPISDADPAVMASHAEEAFDSIVQAISEDAPLQTPSWVQAAPQGCST